MRKLILTILCVALLAAGSAAMAAADSPHAGTADANAWFAFDSVLLGGYVSGKWISAENLLENEEYALSAPRTGLPCSLYGTGGLEGRGAVGAVHREEGGMIPPWTQAVDVTLPNGTTLGYGTARLAVHSSWNPVPRLLKVMATKNTTYEAVVGKYLERQGLPNAKPNIVQLLKIDLEGDGVDEVVLCAQNIVPHDTGAFTWDMGKPLVGTGIGFPSGSYTGDYSLLLLRKIVNGQVREIPLGQFIALKDGTPIDGEQVSPFLYKLCQFADLDGDGVLEIIVSEHYYEGYRSQVFTVKGDKLVRVLVNGSGV